MIMLKEMLLGGQTKAVWTERPFRAGKPLIRGTDVNPNQHYRVQHSKGREGKAYRHLWTRGVLHLHRIKKCATSIIILAFNFLLLHFLIPVLCCIAACFAMEKEAPTETDLGSYEGKYPKDLFNKTVIVNEQVMGRVAKETDDVIVVFSDTDSSIRFDIPKSEISTAGASVIANEDLLFRYRTHRDAPMPEDTALRAS